MLLQKDFEFRPKGLRQNDIGSERCPNNAGMCIRQNEIAFGGVPRKVSSMPLQISRASF
jgi:hypothetical protein